MKEIDLNKLDKDLQLKLIKIFMNPDSSKKQKDDIIHLCNMNLIANGHIEDGPVNNLLIVTALSGLVMRCAVKAMDEVFKK